jgi:hypothetical protein
MRRPANGVADVKAGIAGARSASSRCGGGDRRTQGVSGATRAGGGAQRQEAPPRNCYHAVAVRANVVVESVVCGDEDSTGQTSEIVDRISAKLPQ